MGFTRLIVTMLIRKLEVVELSDLTELNTLNSMNVPLFTKSCPRILFVQIQVQFVLENICHQALKYSFVFVLGILPTEVATETSNLIDEVLPEAYGKLSQLLSKEPLPLMRNVYKITDGI